MSEIVDCIGWIIRKTCWSFWICMKFISLRFLDLLGLILNIAACATIVRLPAMIMGFSSMENLVHWRYIGLVNLLIFLMDIPIFIMAFIVLITLWRIPSCWKDMKEEWDGWSEYHVIYFIRFEIRGVIVKHFFTLFIDVFCVPSAIICLLSWRCCIFVDEMKKADDDWKRRKICFTQCVQVFLDIPLILCIIIAACSWRLPFLVFEIRKRKMKDKKWDAYRYRGIIEFFHLLVDIPCIILFLLTFCTWRCPVLIWQVTGVYDDIFKSKTQWNMRKMIILQFLYIFTDIPCIIALMVILITIWRLPSLYHHLKEANEKTRTRSNFYKKEFRIRGVIMAEFVMIFVDIFCFIMLLVVLLTIWRTYPIVKEMKKYLKRYKTDNSNISKQKHYGTFEGVPPVKETNVDDQSVHLNDGDNQSVHLDNGDNQPLDHNDETQTRSSPTEINPTEITDDIDSINDENRSEPTDEEKDEKKPLTWNKCMWKIRKTICTHFVMLFLDIPAIPLSVILLITGLRTTALISAVLGSGNFYMLFAVTVYYQAFRFVVDLFFLLLFIVLMLLRPIQSWVHLLEDEDHKKNRLLREILVWVPDICNERQKVYEELDELLNVSIKENILESTTKQNMRTIMNKHLAKLTDLLDALNKHEIEDVFLYHLKCVLFMEEKRTTKLLRKFFVQQRFILRADVDLHKDNLHKWNTEMREYESSVTEKYTELLKYKPEKVPLYETKSGLSLRSRKETRKVLINCLPKGRSIVLLMSLLCCIPLYRAPKMFIRLFRKWYDKFNIVTNTLKEYALDFLALLRILIVIVCVYRAPMMMVDILDSIIEKRSWKAVRSVVKKYPIYILEDVAGLIATLFSWETPRFIFTAILFGLLMPADMFLTVSKLCIKNNCLSYLLTTFIYIVVVGFPFVFGLYGAKELLEYGIGWSNVVVLCVFGAVLLGTLSLMVMSLIRDEKRTFVVEMPPCDYVRLSWTNVNVFLFEIVEFLQAMALIFKLSSIPMYGSNVLNDASQYLLFSFLPFKIVFWMSVALFIIWFFLCAAPVILENILEDYDVGTCGKKSSWRLAVSVFANTLFVSMIENLISFSACSYETCPSNYTLGKIPANASCANAIFVEDNSYECWSEEHRTYAVVGLICLVWYTTTALIFDTKYGDPDTSDQDIGFSPVYNTGLNILKAIMVVVVSIVTNSPYVVVGVLLACNIASILFTLLFRPLFRHEPCNLPNVLVWRLFTFISCVVTVIAVLIAFVLDDKSSKIPLIIIGAGVFLTLIIAIATAVYLRQESKTERDRQDFKLEIRLLESRLTKNNWLLLKWKKEKGMWHRLVKSVHQAGKNDRRVDRSVWALQNMQRDNLPIYEETVAEQLPPMVDQSTGVEETDANPSENRNVFHLSEAHPEMTGVYRLEKNGRNLLAIVEKHIRYEAYRYSFLSQRHLWLNSIWMSDWTGLVECLRILNSNIKGSFDQPSPLDISLSPTSIPEDKLENDPQDVDTPPDVFVRQTKLTIAQTSMECRQKALNDFAAISNYGEEWSTILDKLLPTEPVIKSWTYADGHFELLCRRPCSGTIVEIDPSLGNKLAKGASFTIGKVFRGHLTNFGLVFDDGYAPVAKKGPVNVTVTKVSFVKKGNVLYLSANGKKVKYDVAIASCKTIKWS